MSETEAKTEEVVAPAADVAAPEAETTEEAVEEVTQSLEEILALGQGLDDQDYKAELEVLQNDPNSNLYSAVTFEELNLPELLLKGVYNMKFAKPSKIQSVALPLILADPPENLIGQAQSGSGKTATFALGMLYRVDVNLKAPQAVCVGPTRELVRQIMAVVNAMGKFIGTPGKVEGMIKKKQLDTRNVKIFVLDEADVMVAEDGMRERSVAIKRLIKNRACQYLLFSATYADDVRDFAQKMVPDHNIITVKKEKLTLDGIKQFWIDCKSRENKFQVLSDIFAILTIGKCVIFVQQRDTAKELTRAMREKGHSVGILHGADMAKEVRDQVIDEFRAGTTNVLITTNVLARGIDVAGVSLVVNFDIPLTRDHRPDPETYLHRIGRTGRFGRKGCAINFVYDNKSKQDLAEIEEYYARRITQAPADDIEELEKLLAWE
ncbi:ATP-dependent RNA helicase [Phytophthora fragariae]|uniref:RNA helicase n=1 Tax=Phytophthora fragariae TaxID=53985 RepID=A0A6A4BR02_9STRA|nr:ATP-dependent RNA helicase [Phytophthora fragariae]KAE9082549.1 ATP-dependent RNA helicase [Phytophthora fragariae]KAE9274767.1 ATP-dependent RNA helicase [Phytophthora fragariae]KAE9285314.1 ATP-dependent RNA helicase [Phytophthora fragariae]